MSNEEILEEIYYEIHKMGLFNQFCEVVEKIQKKDSKMSHQEVVNNVYHELKIHGELKSF